jgi:hypothetical protein
MTTKKILIGIVVLCLLFAVGRWLHLQFAYSEIERLTEQHGNELSSAVNTSVTDEITSENEIAIKPELDTIVVEYFKVFEYSESEAKVFVVIRSDIKWPTTPPVHDRIGQFRYFIRQNGTWMVNQNKRPFELVWDTLGSADDETWPPYH